MVGTCTSCSAKVGHEDWCRCGWAARARALAQLRSRWEAAVAARCLLLRSDEVKWVYQVHVIFPCAFI